ncbi:protein kinase domain-containing protein [Streptomyces qinzhouensis]|uniref:ABC transporter substrate-binding protein n=1 Tax=Streptomyces qinzhouensis TaxID=2599401 RepID=A0A5B8JD81_9ACTN|nr:ABC transporter substrate-binding protein [Streptomyces qinzhouensis]QDY75640.1 ABC transporter substrate-binding protein [Streptomyces qinzhouensis]
MERLLPSDPSHLGAYRLLRRLGAGGMGVVYLARAENGDPAAVKVIQPEYAENHAFRDRFRREVATARRVRSPWVVPVLDADTEAGSPWLATAFVPGPSLAEAVMECGVLPSRAVRVLGKVLARALAAVHTAGLVHRDVKPGNVLLAMDGPRLIDFGIARSTSAEATELTSAGVVVGTPGFLSPEQARAHEVGAAADVFSLACVLVYAATGRPPFGTGAVETLLYRTVHDTPDLTGLADEGLRELLGRCLAKDPAERPGAAEVDEALAGDAPEGTIDWLPDPVVLMIARRSEAMLTLPGIEPTLVPESTVPQQPPPGRRRILALAAGGTALLATGGGAALWWALRDREKAPPAAPTRIVGLHADLSGPQKADGIAQERAARLAVAEFNARAGKPFTLSLEVLDDKGEAARAVGAARRLTGNPEVLAVVGPTGYASAVAAVEVYERAGLPLVSVTELSLAAGNTSLLGSPKWYYRAAPIRPYTAFGTMMAMAAQGARRPGMLIDRTGGITRWELTFLAKMSARNLALDLYVRVVPERARPDSVLSDMLARDIDGLYYTGTPERAAIVARALAGRRFAGPRFLDASSATAEFAAAAGAQGEGWQAITPHIGPDAEPVRAFATAYRRRYGTPPPTGAAETYDAIRMLADRIVSLRDGADRRQVGQALAGVRFKGLTQTFAYNDSHHLKATHVHHYAVGKGRFDYLAPLKLPE